MLLSIQDRCVKFKALGKTANVGRIKFNLGMLRCTCCHLGGDDDPYQLSFRGLDNSVYYMLNKEEYTQLLNYSGCGNTVSGNHPVVKQLIIDACRRYAPSPACSCSKPQHLVGPIGSSSQTIIEEANLAISPFIGMHKDALRAGGRRSHRCPNLPAILDALPN